MTKEKAKELSGILKAYSEGKVIQRELKDSWQDIKELNGEDIKQATIKMAGDFLNLRIKPERKLVPFTIKDILNYRHKFIKDKCNDNLYYLIVGYDLKESEVLIGDNWIDLKELLKNYEFEDGSPCGKYIEE